MRCQNFSVDTPIKLSSDSLVDTLAFSVIFLVISPWNLYPVFAFHWTFYFVFRPGFIFARDNKYAYGLKPFSSLTLLYYLWVPPVQAIVSHNT